MQMIEFAFSLLLFLSYPVHISCIAVGISKTPTSYFPVPWWWVQLPG